MAVQQETLMKHTPAHRQTQEGGLPSLPNRPRTPHLPHSRAIAVGLALAIAGTAVGGIFRKTGDTVINEMPTVVTLDNQHEFIFDGRLLVNLSMSPEGEVRKEPTTRTQILKAESITIPEGEELYATDDIAAPEGEQHRVTLSPVDLSESYFVPVAGRTYGQDTKDHYADMTVNRDVALGSEPILKDPFGSVNINGIEVGIFFRVSNADGSAKLGPNEKPVYVKPSQVDVAIPEAQNQVPQPVNA